MKFDPQKHHRHSIRLPEYDYSQPGAYFITLVTYGRECLLGEIREGEMQLSEPGRVVWEVWESLPARYPQITTGAAIVMPNHFHGIVMIQESEVGAIHELPLQRRRMTIPLVVGYFKMNTAKRINRILSSADVPVWQKNYYEHIIRNIEELQRINQYIETNVDRWAMDDENPARIG